MARYIDADALKERLSLVGVVADDLYGMGINRGLDRAETEIDMLPTADVVPRRILFDLESKLHTMLPFKAHPIPIDGKCTGNSYDLGQERVIYDILNYLGELEKKYAEGNHANH